MPTPSTPRALIIKLGAIGDVLMAIPAAAALHAAGWQIDWLTGPAAAPLLALYPWIHVLPADESALLRGSSAQRLRSIASAWKALRRRSAQAGPYTLVATLYYDRRFALLTLPLRPSHRVALSHADRRFALLPGRHHTDEYHRILLGLPDTATPAQLAPVRPSALPPSPLPAATRPRIVLFPAGARNTQRDDALRRWDLPQYVTLAQKLLQSGFEVILAGGPDDRWASAAFAHLASAHPGAFSDRIAAFTLPETLGLLEASDLTITHDTGPLHLAGLAICALIGIFGPTDPRGRLPQRPGTVAFWGGEGFSCRPCYDGRDYATCPHNNCMDQVTPAMVLAEVHTLLAARRAGQSLLPRVLTPPHAALVQLYPEPTSPEPQ